MYRKFICLMLALAGGASAKAETIKKREAVFHASRFLCLRFLYLSGSIQPVSPLGNLTSSAALALGRYFSSSSDSASPSV